MALKTVFEYCFNAIEFYPKSNRFVLASRRKSNHFVLKIRLGGFADYISNISMTEKAVEGIISCDDMELERSIEANLHCVKSYELKNNTVLYLKDTYGHILMELTKQ